MVTGVYGHKQFDAILEGTLVYLVFLMERLKDGADIGDAVALVTKVSTDAQFKAKTVAMIEALVQADETLKEIKDLTSDEITEIAIKFVPKILEVLGALKK